MNDCLRGLGGIGRKGLQKGTETPSLEYTYFKIHQIVHFIVYMSIIPQ